jgi:hypothetical protein
MEAPQFDEPQAVGMAEVPVALPILLPIPPPQAANSSTPQVDRPASEPRIVFDLSMVLTFRT